VYITAFALDAGESVAALIKDPPPRCARTADTAAARRLFIPRQGEVPRFFRAATWTQTKPRSWPTPKVPWGLAALSGKISEPAWRAKPSWYLIANRRQDDPT